MPSNSTTAPLSNRRVIEPVGSGPFSWVAPACLSSACPWTGQTMAPTTSSAQRRCNDQRATTCQWNRLSHGFSEQSCDPAAQFRRALARCRQRGQLARPTIRYSRLGQAYQQACVCRRPASGRIAGRVVAAVFAETADPTIQQPDRRVKEKNGLGKSLKQVDPHVAAAKMGQFMSQNHFNLAGRESCHRRTWQYDDRSDDPQQLGNREHLGLGQQRRGADSIAGTAAVDDRTPDRK